MIDIKKNIALADFTTFKIGGPADFFIEPRSAEEILEALTWAQEQRQSVYILGGGSNVVFDSKGFRGVVIHPLLTDISISNETVTCQSGVTIANLLSYTLDQGLVGLEFLAGIPGTLGGAIYGNAGTYGLDTNSVLTSLEWMECASKKIITKPSGEISFAYHHSQFKDMDPVIIIKAELQLRTGDISASRALIAERDAYRAQNHPIEPSAGCIFKNVPFADVDLNKLRQLDLDIDKFQKFQKIPTGYLIETVGLKGKQIGGAKISEKHSNYIVNVADARFEDVATLVSLIKQQVRDRFGIQLQEEAQIIPERLVS